MIRKSTNPDRIPQHIDVFDFELGPDELAHIDRLD